MTNRYYCHVYKYDQYGRNLILESTVGNIQAYANQLNRSNYDWDEFEYSTESDTMSILSGINNSKFLGKVVNPRSRYIIIAEG